MNRHALFRVALSMFLPLIVTSCATTTFKEYRGASYVPGSGGTMRIVDGVDFWDDGIPDTDFHIIGIIEDARRDNIAARGSRDRAVAAKAKEHNANAVVLIGAHREATSVSQYGNIHYDQRTKYLAVKYSQDSQPSLSP